MCKLCFFNFYQVKVYVGSTSSNMHVLLLCIIAKLTTLFSDNIIYYYVYLLVTSSGLFLSLPLLALLTI